MDQKKRAGSSLVVLYGSERNALFYLETPLGNYPVSQT